MPQKLVIKRLTFGCIFRFVFIGIFSTMVPALLVLIILNVLGVSVALLPADSAVDSGVDSLIMGFFVGAFLAFFFVYVIASVLYLGHLLYSRIRSFTLRFIPVDPKV